MFETKLKVQQPWLAIAANQEKPFLSDEYSGL